MIKIAISPCDMIHRAIYLSATQLPLNYMEDFSVMGFVVDRCDHAIELLDAAGYVLERMEIGAVLYVESSAVLPEIQALFIEKKIYSTYTDIADTIYQA